MIPPDRNPLLDFIPDFPKHRTLREAWRRWWGETWGWMVHTLRPTESELPPPVRGLAPPAGGEPPEDLGERLAAAKALVDSADKRLDTVRSKATSLLGFTALLTPVLSWWLLTGRERIAAAPVPVAAFVYGLIAVAAFSFALCLRALFRSQSVAAYQTPTPSLFVDVEKGELRPHDWAGELVSHFSVWGDVQRWADVVTDYFRAGQRFLAISLAAAVVAGVVSYVYPQPNRVISLVLRPTGELGLVGLGPATAPDDLRRWETLAWYAVAAALVALAAFFLGRSRPAVGLRPSRQVPCCRNVVQLSGAAAKHVQEHLSAEGKMFLRVTAIRAEDGSVEQRINAVDEIYPESDYLGESGGVQIVVDHAAVGAIGFPFIDVRVDDQGLPAFEFHKARG